MSNYNLALKKVSKTFGRRLIFRDIDFVLESGGICGIAGPNGSGKSTLARILCGIISPTAGKVIHTFRGKIITRERIHNYLGFLSPYLFLYDEFTAEENLIYSANIRGISYDKSKVDFLFDTLNLLDRKNDLLREYSSGMKQRMKLIFALLHSPPLLILDEPTANLDNEGKEIFYEIIKQQSADNLVIIASNENGDLNLCDEVIQLKSFKEEVKR